MTSAPSDGERVERLQGDNVFIWIIFQIAQDCFRKVVVAPSANSLKFDKYRHASVYERKHFGQSWNNLAAERHRIIFKLRRRKAFDAHVLSADSLQTVVVMYGDNAVP